MPKGFTTKNIKLKCLTCGKEFKPKTYNQKFCSTLCKQRNVNYKAKRRRIFQVNKEKANFQNKIRMALYKVKIFELLGNKCAKCGETDWRLLQIDHVNGGGTRERKLGVKEGSKRGNSAYHHIWKEIVKEGKKDKYQLLCANCNWLKRYERDELTRDRYPDQPTFIEIFEEIRKGRTEFEWKGRKYPVREIPEEETT